MHKSSLMLCAAALALLAACGGGGGGSDTTVAPAPQGVEYVPTAASEGVSVFAGWLKQMSGQSLESKDAMNTSTFTPTVQDDAEPVAAPL